MTRLDDLKFDFHGRGGREYLMFANAKFKVTGRMKVCEDDTCHLDRVTVTTPEHVVRVDHEGVLIDGQAPTDQQRQPGGWVWVGDGGVAVGVDGWLIGIILDDGTGEVHRGGVLDGVPHVSLFVTPPVDPSWEGLLATGHGGCQPEDYEV